MKHIRSTSSILLAITAIAWSPISLAPAVTTHLRVVQEGSTARYRVRERLVGKELDNDAVGVTTRVTGEVALDSLGRIDAEASVITVDVTSLTSDAPRRDRYVRSRVLDTEKFPTVQLRARGAEGLPHPLPSSGEFSFVLVGDLSIHGVTRPTRWTVKAQGSDRGFTGQATTSLTFADFHLNQPRVPVVLSVNDTIRLEYDFSVHREN